MRVYVTYQLVYAHTIGRVSLKGGGGGGSASTYLPPLRMPPFKHMYTIYMYQVLP